MNLRDYQQRTVDAAFASWAGGVRRCLAIAATGAGKTIIAAEVMRRAEGPCLFLADAETLVTQNAAKFEAHTGEPCGIEMAKSYAGPHHRVVIASAQSLARRLASYPPNHFSTIICDEAHRNSLGAYPRAIFAHFPSANILGLTATPWRMDGSSLGDVYEKVVADISLAELMDAGHLCRVTVKSIPLRVDMRQVRRIAGDYSLDDIAEAIRPHLVAAVDQLKTHAHGRKVAVYLPLCSISREFAALCQSQGLRAVHVDGEDKSGLAAFESGEADIVCNASLLTTGWDYPPLDCVLILRPTRSLSLYAQIVGRGTRTAPGKRDCLLLDPLFLSDDHELVRPADMGAKRRREKGDPVPAQDGDLLAVVRKAEDMHAKSVAAKARESERKSKREADLMAIRAIPEWQRKPTPAQVWTLTRARVDMAKIKSYADAKRALIAVFAKKKRT